jgi:hypothetical protein
MASMNRRQALRVVAASSTAALTASAAAAAGPQPKKSKHNSEPPAPSKTTPEKVGPRELFAVVDRDGALKRGLHAVSAGALDTGVYEVVFSRDVRKGVYVATIGDPGFQGVPPIAGSIAVVGRANDPRGVLVYVTDTQGVSLNSGFHLLVICPEGYA